MLPGLEPPARGEPAIVSATRRTLAAMEALGLVDELHAQPMQLLLDLAWVVDSGRRQGKASAVAMAAAQMIATYQLLMPESAGGGETDEWNQLVADLRRSSPALRDPT